MQDYVQIIRPDNSHPSLTVLKVAGHTYRRKDFLAFRNQGLNDSWARFAACLVYQEEAKRK